MEDAEVVAWVAGIRKGGVFLLTESDLVVGED
jgi:hypothetical protein